MSSAVSLAGVIPHDDWSRVFVPELQARAKDRSWSVRHCFVAHLKDLVLVAESGRRAAERSC